MKLHICLMIILSACATVWARPANYDESKIAPYTLPDPLVFKDGTKVTSAAQWQARRLEIMALFEDQMFGVIPPPTEMRLEVLQECEVFEGSAIRRQLRMWLSARGQSHKVDWILFVPKSSRPVPAYIGLNYYGNQEIDKDPTILITDGWLRNNKDHFISNHRASAESRGLNPDAWPARMLTRRGYALATACYGEIAPDDPMLYTNGIHRIFPPTTPGVGSDTTAIGAWAWTLLRGMDMLEREPGIDSKRVAVVGCSRLAKTALLAGAKDERFAVVIPNQTGGGGVPLAKRDYGENVALQNQKFPHWFCGNFRQYSDNEAAMPFDQHMLLTACAPRRLYVSSFPGKWFDPYGEFLSMKAAEPVWRLLGVGGLPAEEWPEEMCPVMGSHLAYHRRPFEHGIAIYDWECYLAFSDEAFGMGIDWQPERSDKWKQFTRHHFTVAGRPAWVVVPERPLPGNPWLWAMEFPTAFDDRTGAAQLVAAGFHYLYIDVGNTFGAPAAQRQLDAFYDHIVDKGLSSKGSLLAISRGGLYAYRFATRHPDRIVTIYGDAPVCDFKSWPAGLLGRAKGSEADWQALQRHYGFKDAAEALNFKGNPVDVLEPLAKAGVPLIHVVGDADSTVPIEENSDVLARRYRALGGEITIFNRPGAGHHPHGLDDSAPVVELIRKYTTAWDIERSKMKR